jgi:hypothetical protein
MCVSDEGEHLNGTVETYAEGIHVKETAGEQWRTREGEGDHIGEGIG